MAAREGEGAERDAGRPGRRERRDARGLVHGVDRPRRVQAPGDQVGRGAGADERRGAGPSEPVRHAGGGGPRRGRGAGLAGYASAIPGATRPSTSRGSWLAIASLSAEYRWSRLETARAVTP